MRDTLNEDYKTRPVLLSKMLEFKNEYEFCKWKNFVEKTNSIRFVKTRGSYFNSVGKVVYYTGRRCVKYRSNLSSPSKKEQQIKIQGLSIDDSNCPTGFKARFFNHGFVQVEYVATQIEHSDELSHSTLPIDKGKPIASKIASKVPFNITLNEVSPSAKMELKREHCITKQDLRNTVGESLNGESLSRTDDPITVDLSECDERLNEQNLDNGDENSADSDCLCLNDDNGAVSKGNNRQITKPERYNTNDYCLASECFRYSGDLVSVDLWVRQVQKSDDNPVILYKAQGVVDLLGFPYFSKDCFMLGVMSDTQAEMLKTYGNECICVDTNVGKNGFRYSMITLLVLDDRRQGYPCAFFFSNRNDRMGIEEFCKAIKDKVGVINANIIMTDVSNAFYFSWRHVMSMKGRQLFCTWHIQKTFRRRINRLKGYNLRKNIMKKMYGLLCELDENVFETEFSLFIDELKGNPQSLEFGIYLTNFFFSNRQSWAYCYRRDTVINTNMHLERSHCILKYLFSKAKTNKSVDSMVYTVVKFFNCKLFDHNVVMRNDKITCKLINFKDRHKKSLCLSADNVLKSSDFSWTIFVPPLFDIYTVTLVESSCDCSLICEHCNICIHRFNCTCADSCMNWNMCVHIHLLCQVLSASEPRLVKPNEKANDMVIDNSANSIAVCGVKINNLQCLKQLRLDVTNQFVLMMNKVNDVKQLRLFKDKLKDTKEKFDWLEERKVTTT